MTIYEIRVRGHLDQRWSPWFAGSTDGGVEDTVVKGTSGKHIFS